MVAADNGVAVDHWRRGEPLAAISDSYGTPTYAPDLARRLRELATLDLPGTYHVVNQGEGVSYHQFSLAALAAAKCRVDVRAVQMSDLARPAPRPVNSRLRCLLSPALGLAPLPSWEEALQKFAGESR